MNVAKLVSTGIKNLLATINADIKYNEQLRTITAKKEAAERIAIAEN